MKMYDQRDIQLFAEFNTPIPVNPYSAKITFILFRLKNFRSDIFLIGFKTYRCQQTLKCLFQLLGSGGRYLLRKYIIDINGKIL